MIEQGFDYRPATNGLALPSDTGVLEIEEIKGVARYILRGGDAVIPLISQAFEISLEQPVNRATSLFKVAKSISMMAASNLRLKVLLKESCRR